MNDSCLSDLSVHGQAMNFGNVNTPNRLQWGGGPRGTIINVLEHASVYDHTLTSTTNSETSDISLKALSNRVNPNRHNETYVISNPKPIASSNLPVGKPMENDLVVEDLSQTLTVPIKQDKNQT
jgi:hypothetical protein